MLCCAVIKNDQKKIEQQNFALLDLDLRKSPQKKSPPTVMKSAKKVVLIPGASRPLGRAVAHAFGSAGISLILPYIDDWPGSVEDMVSDFSRSGYSFFPHPCNLTEPGETREFISTIEERFGCLHYLVNNIERGGMPVVHGSYDRTVNKSQWQLEFDTTLKAKWELVHRCLPLIREKRRRLDYQHLLHCR